MNKVTATMGKSIRQVSLIIVLFQLLFLLLAVPRIGQAASVILDWDPSTDPDLAGYKVYYQANSAAIPFAGTGAAEGAAPVDSGNATTATINGLDPNNSFYFAVTAYNSAGIESVYSNIIHIPESVAPVVSVTSPAQNSSASGTVSIAAAASDNVAVTKVAFLVNGVQVAETATSPYAYSWNTAALAPGNYTISAKAFDAAGNEGTSTGVTVNVGGDVVAPTVSLAGPVNGSTVSGNVAVTAGASDNVGVTRIEIYVDGSLALSSNQSSVGYTWNTSLESNGTHVLTAKAYDQAGNVGQSAPLSVSVLNDSVPPVVAITSPALNSAVSGTVAVSAYANDDVAMNKVEFYVNGVLKATASSAPYGFSWNTAGLSNGIYTLSAKAYDKAGNLGYSANHTVSIAYDSSAPTVISFSLPATYSSTTVPITAIGATDNVAVTAYLVTESATAPTASAAGWSAIAPTSFTFAGTGSRTAYAWAKDAAGNVSAGRSATVTITLPDTTAPQVTAFTMPGSSTTLNVPISTLTAADNVGVTGYSISESATAPAATSGAWSAVKPTSFTFAAAGVRTAYLWAKDAAGNVSVVRSATVTITLPDTTAPQVTAFTMPGSSTTLNVPISTLTAADNVGVTGYLISESATAPAATSGAWSAVKPTGFTFAAAGARTAYVWGKDAAGNISVARSATVTITLPDTTAPQVTSFTLPAIYNSTTVPVSVSASDAVGVAGYRITETATAPLASAAGWSATAPTSFTFSGTGSRAAYAWAKDAAGNVSLAKSATTIIDTELPIITSMTLGTSGKTVTLRVAASDNVAVNRIEVYLDNVLQVTSYASPLTHSWEGSRSQILTVKVFDKAGNVRTRSLKVSRS